MQKYVYLIWRPETQPLKEFRKMFLEKTASALLKASPLALSVSLAEPDIDGICRPLEDGSLLSALVSAKVDSSGQGKALFEKLNNAGGFSAGYEVTEAIPVDYEKNWPDGELTPGVSQITCLRRKDGMAYDGFINYWHNRHTPLALEIHPLWRYVRNVVEKAITPNAPDYDGIVELVFRAREDVMDIDRFFGGDMKKNMPRIAEDVGNFINLDTIEVTGMTEFVLKTLKTGRHS